MRKKIMLCVKGITRNTNLLTARNPVLGLTIIIETVRLYTAHHYGDLKQLNVTDV